MQSKLTLHGLVWLSFRPWVNSDTGAIEKVSGKIMMKPILNPSKGVYLYNCTPYDSKEEIYFSWYLDELFEGGYIAEYDYQPPAFDLSDRETYSWIKVLKTKNKAVESTLLQPHTYTADFCIKWNICATKRFITMSGKKLAFPFYVSENITWIDIKPVHDLHNMTRQFHINQKWVYQRYGVYVQKIIIQKLFEKTFTPARYLLTDKSLKSRKIDFKAIPLTEFIGG